MFANDKRNRPHHPVRDAYTLIELLAVTFVVAVTALVGGAAGREYGILPGIGAGILTATSCVMVVIQFYRWMWHRDKRRLQELRDKYRLVYRVTSLPSHQTNIIKPAGAEIRVGDYGWEAEPILKDGLIHLQGLTLEWGVVWDARFRPNEVEQVATKPCSQYDYWVPHWASRSQPPLPPCPFPILLRETLTMGRPHHSGRYMETQTRYPK
jgi:hypothetical protein